MTMLKSLCRVASAGLGAIVAMALLTSASQAQQAYSSPEEAAASLAAAVKTGTRSAILKVLGNDGADIVESGDDVADAEMRQRFLSAYDARNSIKAEGNKKATLILGADDFPFPIPLVNNRRGWEFDTAAGRLEILYRRIGRNEMDAIQTCLAFVDAENEYAEKDRTGEGTGVYAQRIVSSPGKKDGLFWRDDRDPSPLGELAAQASAEGYNAGEQAAPYHGYYFRILKGQGSDAPGGALNYVVKGKDDRRLRADRISRRVRKFRRHDLHGQSCRYRLREGSRRTDREDRQSHSLVRPGSDLEEDRCGDPLNAGS